MVVKGGETPPLQMHLAHFLNWYNLIRFLCTKRSGFDFAQPSTQVNPRLLFLRVVRYYFREQIVMVCVKW
jgi:hypothetical protein